MGTDSVRVATLREAALRAAPQGEVVRFEQSERELVRVARPSLGLGDLLVVDREVEAGAGGELADELALQLLPRRLALLDVRLPRRAALGELLVGDQDVGGALADIDPDL